MIYLVAALLAVVSANDQPEIPACIMTECAAQMGGCASELAVSETAAFMCMVEANDPTCNGCLVQVTIDGADGEIPECYATDCPASTLKCMVDPELEGDDEVVECFMADENVDEVCQSCMESAGGSEDKGEAEPESTDDESNDGNGKGSGSGEKTPSPVDSKDGAAELSIVAAFATTLLALF